MTTIYTLEHYTGDRQLDVYFDRRRGAFRTFRTVDGRPPVDVVTFDQIGAEWTLIESQPLEDYLE